MRQRVVVKGRVQGRNDFFLVRKLFDSLRATDWELLFLDPGQVVKRNFFRLRRG